jgi:hypothetical protein
MIKTSSVNKGNFSVFVEDLSGDTVVGSMGYLGDSHALLAKDLVYKG